MASCSEPPRKPRAASPAAPTEEIVFEIATHIPWAGLSDPVSSLTHLIGAVVFAALAIELVKRGGNNRLRLGALAIYAASVVTALVASGALHAVDPTTDLRSTLARVDHSAIFILIAGTYTPVHIIQFKGVLRWGLLGLIWSAALSGMVLKLLFFTQIPEWVGLSIYLGLGWAGLISATFLFRMTGFRPLLPLVAGALFYTVGALLDFLGTPVLKTGVFAAHETFHLCVLAGVASHWLYIRRIAVSAPITDLYATASANPSRAVLFTGERIPATDRLLAQ